MRAKEFITEAELFDFGGYRMSILPVSDRTKLLVRALDDWGNNEIGRVLFNIGDNKELDPQDLIVDEKYRGKGIAKAMYDFVKSKGYVILKSSDQTSDGARFWNKNRGNETIWEETISEALPKWATTALAGAAIGTMGAIASHTPQRQEPVASQQTDAPKSPLKKADQNLVNHMHGVLNTPAGKATVSAARRAGLKGRELAAFLAQCSVESIDFTTLKELGGRLDFKKYDIKHNPKKAKLLGNIHPGDGEKYVGRGIIQLTGRDNYRRAGKALGLPLEDRPELAERPDIAAKVAIWYWQNRVHPKVTHFDNTRSVTKRINSGLAKLSDRHERYKAVAQLLGVLNWPKGNQVTETSLDEMALPVEWDADAIDHDRSFASKLKYCRDRAARLGVGSSRAAFMVEDNGKPTALKIAINKKGLAQNKAEVDILTDNYISMLEIAIPLIDYDKSGNSPSWVQTEVATRATEKQLCKIMKCDFLGQLVDYANYLIGKWSLSDTRTLPNRFRANGKSEEDIGIFIEYANKLATLGSSTSLHLADFNVARNWGIYDNRPVVIDMGFNDEVAKLYRNL